MKIRLDLGVVNNLATVIINGREIAKLWKPPYTADITSALKPGVNTLEIIVTNTMVNRMIGDEMLPQDVSYSQDDPNQWIIDKFPEWLVTPELRTSGRQTFVTYQYFHKDSPLGTFGVERAGCYAVFQQTLIQMHMKNLILKINILIISCLFLITTQGCKKLKIIIP
jgi:hypothetical protein